MKKDTIKGKHGYEVEANKALRDIMPGDYDVLLLPGGKAPEAVRKEEKAREIARYFFEKNRPVFAICHGPQILISAGLLKGRRATCYNYKTVAAEMQEAGALYEDKEVVVDGSLVTSRQPSGPPAFLRVTMKMIKGLAAFRPKAA
jgi:protease I